MKQKHFPQCSTYKKLPEGDSSVYQKQREMKKWGRKPTSLHKEKKEMEKQPHAVVEPGFALCKRHIFLWLLQEPKLSHRHSVCWAHTTCPPPMLLQLMLGFRFCLGATRFGIALTRVGGSVFSLTHAPLFNRKAPSTHRRAKQAWTFTDHQASPFVSRVAAQGMQALKPRSIYVQQTVNSQQHNEHRVLGKAGRKMCLALRELVCMTRAMHVNDTCGCWGTSLPSG